MAGPEDEPSNSDQPTQAELKAELWDLFCQIEKANENENIIERTLELEQLEEIRDILEEELAERFPSTNETNPVP